MRATASEFFTPEEIETARAIGGRWPGPFTSVAEIQEYNALTERHFFDKHTVGFFKSQTEPNLASGRLFLTSEREKASDPPRYTIRCASDNGAVSTIGKFMRFTSLATANRAMVALAVELQPDPGPGTYRFEVLLRRVGTVTGAPQHLRIAYKTGQVVSALLSMLRGTACSGSTRTTARAFTRSAGSTTASRAWLRSSRRPTRSRSSARSWTPSSSSSRPSRRPEHLHPHSARYTRQHSGPAAHFEESQMRPFLLLFLCACPAAVDVDTTDTDTEVAVDAAPFTVDTGAEAYVARLIGPPRVVKPAGGGQPPIVEQPTATCKRVENFPCMRSSGRGDTNCDYTRERCVCTKTTECRYVDHRCIPK